MKIARADLKRLFDELDLTEIPVAISKLKGVVHSSIDKSKLIFKKTFSRADLTHPELLKHDYFYIFIANDQKDLLQRQLPHLFLPVDFRIPLKEAAEFLKKIAFLNEPSPREHKRERHIVFAKDVLKAKELTKIAALKLPVVLHAASHEELTFKNLRILQKNFADHPAFPLELAYQEHGVLVYNEEASTHFSMLTDITTTLKKLNLPHNVLSDSKSFLTAFNKFRPRLSILTYSHESHKSKWLYVLLKRQDALAKILEIDAMTHESPRSLYHRIQTLYHADYFDPKCGMSIKKIELDYKKERRIKDSIAKLTLHYTPLQHAKIAYIVEKLGLHYNITNLKFMLKNLPPKNNRSSIL